LGSKSVLAFTPFIQQYDYKQIGGGLENWDISQIGEKSIVIANSKGILVHNGNSWSLKKSINSKTPRHLYYDESSNKLYTGYGKDIGFYEVIGDSLGDFQLLNTSHLTIDFTEVWKIESFKDEIIFQTDKSLFILKDANIREIQI